MFKKKKVALPLLKHINYHHCCVDILLISDTTDAMGDHGGEDDITVDQTDARGQPW